MFVSPASNAAAAASAAAAVSKPKSSNQRKSAHPFRSIRPENVSSGDLDAQSQMNAHAARMMRVYYHSNTTDDMSDGPQSQSQPQPLQHRLPTYVGPPSSPALTPISVGSAAAAAAAAAAVAPTSVPAQAHYNKPIYHHLPSPASNASANMFQQAFSPSTAFKTLSLDAGSSGSSGSGSSLASPAHHAMTFSLNNKSPLQKPLPVIAAAAPVPPLTPLEQISHALHTVGHALQTAVLSPAAPFVGTSAIQRMGPIPPPPSLVATPSGVKFEHQALTAAQTHEKMEKLFAAAASSSATAPPPPPPHNPYSAAAAAAASAAAAATSPNQSAVSAFAVPLPLPLPLSMPLTFGSQLFAPVTSPQVATATVPVLPLPPLPMPTPTVTATAAAAAAAAVSPSATSIPVRVSAIVNNPSINATPHRRLNSSHWRNNHLPLSSPAAAAAAAAASSPAPLPQSSSSTSLTVAAASLANTNMIQVYTASANGLSASKLHRSNSGFSDNGSDLGDSISEIGDDSANTSRRQSTADELNLSRSSLSGSNNASFMSDDRKGSVSSVTEDEPAERAVIPIGSGEDVLGGLSDGRSYTIGTVSSAAAAAAVGDGEAIFGDDETDEYGDYAYTSAAAPARRNATATKPKSNGQPKSAASIRPIHHGGSAHAHGHTAAAGTSASATASGAPVVKSSGASNFTVTGQRKVCGSCGTKNTPYWRDGWDGVCLCNACGIRYKKRRVACAQCCYVPKKEERALLQCPKCETGIFTG